MKIIVNQIATEYSDEGSGNAIVLLHGWLDSLHSFDVLAARLQESNRVIQLDLPGFGQTEMPPSDWALDDYAAFVAAFIKKLDLTDYVLIGHSFGGRIAIKGCANGKFKPKGLVLIASAGLAKRKTARNYIYTVIAKAGKLITVIPPFSFWRQRLRQALYRSAKSDYLASEYLGKTFVNVINEDLTPFASNLHLPTILIWGANDQETPIAEGEDMHRLIQGSKFVVIPNADHFVHQQMPDEVLAAMRQML